jgi:cysteine synthase A
MGKIHSSICEIIGRTPLMRMRRMETKYGLDAVLLAKLEGLNPAGSAKDRVALSMILAAEKDGR